MNQIESGNCAYYDSSYTSYQAPSIGQWHYSGYNQYSQDAVSPQAYNNHGNYQGYSSKPINYGTNYSINSTPRSYPTPCMGHCNPPKLYADTYNYLTENLMKPVIEEVYHDLKTISAANTVANNAMAANMGLTQGNKSEPNASPVNQNQPQSQIQPTQSSLNQEYELNVTTDQSGSQGQNQMMQHAGPIRTGAIQNNPGANQMAPTQNRVISHNARQLGTVPRNTKMAAPLQSQAQGQIQRNRNSAGRNGL